MTSLEAFYRMALSMREQAIMNTHTHTFSKFALAGAGLATLLALSACGGGGDDAGPDPSQAPASECNAPLETRFVLKWQVSGTRTGIAESENTWGEKVDFNGRTVRRNTELRKTTYSAPTDVAGLTATEIFLDFYTDDDAQEIRTVYGYGSLSGWSNTPRTQTEALIYDPPAVERFSQLMPGQTVETTYTGTRRFEDWDGKVTTEAVSNVRRVTYHGQEVVNVPAGSFTACKFTTFLVNGPEAGTSTHYWLAKGNGISVKVQSEVPGYGTTNLDAIEIRQP